MPSSSKNFRKGGSTDPQMQAVNQPKTNHGAMALFKKGGVMATKKLFGGKETFKEELNEAKAIKSGKISPFQYAKGEEGEKKMTKTTKMARGGGIETKGKTKGKMISMCGGGKTK